MTGASKTLELRTRISRVGLDGREYRVIRPDRPAPHLVLLDQSHWYAGYADRDALTQLGKLWMLAALSPRSIVHLPTRQNASPHEGRSVDLVLSYASLQLRPSRWKAMRARLGDGAAHTAQIPDPGTDHSAIDYARLWHREYRDLMNFDNAGDTLFITGGRESFHRAALDVRSLLKHTVGHKSSEHLCAEIHPGTWAVRRTRHGTPDLLHLQYEPEGW